MNSVLRGKRVLVVDDEPDVAELIRFELIDCEVDSANTFEEGRGKLTAGGYDAAILDVLGVRGYELLAEFADRLPCIMLTAHAQSAEDFLRAVRGRARMYLPKEELVNIAEYVTKVLATERPLWHWLMGRPDFRRWFEASSLCRRQDLLRDLGLAGREPPALP